MTLAAAATSRVALATCVTNLVTRHPSITASAAASVDAAAGGRTILGIGAGHSGVANVGGAPSRPADLREGLKYKGLIGLTPQLDVSVPKEGSVAITGMVNISVLGQRDLFSAEFDKL